MALEGGVVVVGGVVEKVEVEVGVEKVDGE